MIIGLTGTFGAGKGTVAAYLKNLGFAYYSCSDYLRQELRKQGGEETIDNLAKLGGELREKHGDHFLTQQIIKQIKGDAIVDSIRSIGEVEELQKQPDFHLLAVDAPIVLRYERVQQRKRKSDALTFDEFAAKEQAQLTNQSGRMQLQAVIDMADKLIKNDSTVQAVHQQVEEFINERRKT